MFGNESTSTLVRGVPKMVHRQSSASWYDPKFTFQPMTHPDSVNLDCAGLYFLPKNVPIKGSTFINILKEHLLTF